MIADSLQDSGVSPEDLGSLASSLVWRMGRLGDDSPVTVRVGLAQSLAYFNELPRLRNASDQELEEAIRTDSLKVEWVGPRLPG